MTTTHEIDSNFSSWFQATTTKTAYDWQQDLGSSAACGDRLIRIPTGYGKTIGVFMAWAYHRLIRKDQSWPLRLVWMLPMRVLVEQTQSEVKGLLQKMDLLWDWESSPKDPPEHRGRVGVHVLMGGSDTGEWHLWPEQPAILIGTQDMLLSRALNRGYAASRARWPADFGLLSQDALWILDEVQLMDVGLATAIQLAAFRLERADKSIRPSHTWAMSATLQEDWLQKSPDTSGWVNGLVRHNLSPGDKNKELWSETLKPISFLSNTKKLPELIIEKHVGLSIEAPLTLVVCNTVDRACEVYGEIQKRINPKSKANKDGFPTSGVEVHLIHSRFRGLERKAWLKTILCKDNVGSRIIVATQVVEAGVDISADLLFTDVCPWSSFVQRLGRVARRGGVGQVFVIDVDLKKPKPYEEEELAATRDVLFSSVDEIVPLVEDGSPRRLELFEQAQPASLVHSLYPYDPKHILLKQEMEELFDTTPDLSGADLDVSRYIRSGEERDVLIFWVGEEALCENGKSPKTPDPKKQTQREGLVAVPFLKAQDWLFGKGDAKSKPKNLLPKVQAWVWDYLDGKWRRPNRGDLWPGQTVLVHYDVGGYSSTTGWDSSSKAKFELVPMIEASPQEQADSSDNSEALSEQRAKKIETWENSGQTILFHSSEVATQLAEISRQLQLSEALSDQLNRVARWHDVGKAHPAFQGALRDYELAPRPKRQDLAKGPAAAWRRGKDMYQILGGKDTRPGFRHELASALAWFAVLIRHAPNSHPSLLGAWEEFGKEKQSSSQTPTLLEQEVLQLSPGDFDLGVYLICSHHGKLRCRLHASVQDHERGFIRGVADTDRLPAVSIQSSSGTETLPSLNLTLEPSYLGLSSQTGRSWTERIDSLREQWGPFALAYLEALVRAADVRASKRKDQDFIDPSILEDQQC
jgi:CRISPR-associated endonuclease/helicase Cas3